MPKRSHKLVLQRPTPLLQKAVTIEWGSMLKQLGVALVSAGASRWDTAAAKAVEALGAIKTEAQPAELATMLIQRSLMRALLDIIGDGLVPSLQKLCKEPDTLADKLELSLATRNIEFGEDFLRDPKSLPVLSGSDQALQWWLEAAGIDSATAASIIERIPSFFVFSLNTEWRSHAKEYEPLFKVLRTPFSSAGDKELSWLMYNSLLERQTFESVFDEPFSLAQLYVPLNATYPEDSSRGHSSSDIALVERNRPRKVVDLTTELEQWLTDPKAISDIRVISGGPGSGKSSFARIFAVQASKKPGIRVLFIPLHLIDPAKSVTDEIKRFIREEGIIKHDPLDGEDREANLLVIFDGLDELASQGKAAAETARAFVRDVQRGVESRNISRRWLKVLISGRELVVQENDSSFRESGQVLTLLPYFIPGLHKRDETDMFTSGGEHYIDPQQLLSKDLREVWWRQYGALTGKRYSGLPKEVNRDDLDEITAQPLLNYLVALTLSRGKVDFKKQVNLNTIYFDLVGAVYERGYERRGTFGPIKHLRLEQFTRVLEEVGLAAWHGDGRTTTVSEIDAHCRTSGLETLLDAFQEGAKAGVTRLLAAFFFRRHGERAGGDPTFIFTHKSFGEYLTSRRIVRGIAKITRERIDRAKDPDDGWNEVEALRHWLQIAGKSAMTQYLHKFIEQEIMLLNTSEVAQIQSELARLFSYILKNGMPLTLMKYDSFREAMFESRNAEESLLAVLNGCAITTGAISEIEHPNTVAFGAWFRRIQGQRTSSESCLAAACLSYLDLSEISLDISDYYGANLSYSRLDGAAINLSCFENANFTKASLRRCHIWRSNFSGASLAEVDLTDAHISESNFDGAIAKGIILTNVNNGEIHEYIAPPAPPELRAVLENTRRRSKAAPQRRIAPPLAGA